MLSPAQKYKLLSETDPDKLTPDVVRKLREEAAAAGDTTLNEFLREIVGEGLVTNKPKNLLFG